MTHYPRPFEQELQDRLNEKSRFIQTILGPRQVGKTSGVLHVLESGYSSEDFLYLSGEEEIFEPEWFLAQVQRAQAAKKKIIVIDEVQKIDDWSELVKRSWDAQKRQKGQMHWVLLGSSSLQLSVGLNESLAGRFEIIRAPHWSFSESKKGFGLNLNDYLHSGGYPASYPLLKEPARFRRYMIDSIFETVISRDIFRYATVKKPALFKQTFMLACQFPAQEVSFNKLLGQLQEAGNVDQIKHYLDLYSQAFLLKTLFKFSSSPVSRLSSPKIIVSAPVFASLFHRRNLTDEERGRVFESAVGSRLCESFESVHYWREGHEEVDFVVEDAGQIYAIEVKWKSRKTSGLKSFQKKYKKSRQCIIDAEMFEDFDSNPRQFIERYSV